MHARFIHDHDTRRFQAGDREAHGDAVIVVGLDGRTARAATLDPQCVRIAARFDADAVEFGGDHRQAVAFLLPQVGYVVHERLAPGKGGDHGKRRHDIRHVPHVDVDRRQACAADGNPGGGFCDPAAHLRKDIQQPDVALPRVRRDPLDRDRRTRDGRGGPEIARLGAVGLDGVDTRPVALAAGDMEPLIAPAFARNTEPGEAVECDVDVRPGDRALGDGDFDPLASTGRDEQECRKKLAADRAVQTGVAAVYSAPDDFHRRAAVAGGRTGRHSQLRQTVQEMLDRPGLHARASGQDGLAPGESRHGREQPHGGARVAEKNRLAAGRQLAPPSRDGNRAPAPLHGDTPFRKRREGQGRVLAVQCVLNGTGTVGQGRRNEHPVGVALRARHADVDMRRLLQRLYRAHWLNDPDNGGSGFWVQGSGNRRGEAPLKPRQLLFSSTTEP